MFMYLQTLIDWRDQSIWEDADSHFKCWCNTEQFHQIYRNLTYRSKKLNLETKSHELSTKICYCNDKQSHFLCVPFAQYHVQRWNLKIKTFILRNIKMYYLLNKVFMKMIKILVMKNIIRVNQQTSLNVKQI